MVENKSSGVSADVDFSLQTALIKGTELSTLRRKSTYGELIVQCGEVLVRFRLLIDPQVSELQWACGDDGLSSVMWSAVWF